MPFADVGGMDAAFRICVDCIGNDRAISGRVYSRRLTVPITFSDLGEVLLRLDEVLEVQGFPQAFQRVRTFGSPREENYTAIAEHLDDGMSREEVEAAQGGPLTLVLNIISRRNSSWQGHVDWLDGTSPQDFSSVLELLKLVQEKLS